MAFFDTIIRIIAKYDGTEANQGLKNTEKIAKEAAEKAAAASKKAAEDASSANKKAAKEAEDAAKKAARAVEDEAKRISQALTQLAQRASRSLISIGTNLTRFITLPLAGIGLGALKVSADFETSMNRVKALTQEAGAAFEAMEEQAKQLGSTTVFTASQAAEAMGFLALAGFEANEIISVMPTTLQLAAAAQIELAQAADITTNVLAGFRLEVEDLAAVNDVLVQTTISTNTNMLELAEAMKLVAPIAAAAGTELTEVSAIIGLLGNNALKGSIAGTTLRNTFAALLIPTKSEADALSNLGISVKDATGKLLPLVDIIEQLERSSAKAGDFLEIFGLRAGPGMAALIGEGSEKLRELIQSLEDSGGIAKKVSDVQLEGLNGALLKLKSITEGVLIAIGDSGLLELATEFTTNISELLAEFKELNVVQQRNIIGWALFAASIGPVIIGVGRLLASFLALKETIALLKVSQLITSFGGLRGILFRVVPLVAGLAATVALLTLAAKENTEAQIKLNEAVLDAEANYAEVQEEISNTNSMFRQMSKILDGVTDSTELTQEEIDKLRESVLNLESDFPGMIDQLGFAVDAEGNLFDAGGDLITGISVLQDVINQFSTQNIINQTSRAITAFQLLQSARFQEAAGPEPLTDAERRAAFEEGPGATLSAMGFDIGMGLKALANIFTRDIQTATARAERQAEFDFQLLLEQVLALSAQEPGGPGIDVGGGAGRLPGGRGAGGAGGAGGRQTREARDLFIDAMRDLRGEMLRLQIEAFSGLSDTVITNADLLERQQDILRGTIEELELMRLTVGLTEEQIATLNGLWIDLSTTTSELDLILAEVTKEERIKLENAIRINQLERERLQADIDKAITIDVADKIERLAEEEAQGLKDAELRRIAIEEAAAKERAEAVRDALEPLIDEFTKFARSLGRLNIGGPLGGLATGLLGIGGEALGASFFGKGGFAKGGAFAEVGFLGGLGPDIVSSLAIGAAGFALNAIFGGDEPLEIAQPLDMRIVEIETRLLNFFNFRGISSFTESQEFIPIFENGLY